MSVFEQLKREEILFRIRRQKSDEFILSSAEYKKKNPALIDTFYIYLYLYI